MILRALALAVLLAGSNGSGARSEEVYVTEIKAYIAASVAPWLAEPVLIDAIKRQNVAHLGLIDADIERLDEQWVEQLNEARRPLIESVLHSELSLFLQKKMRESNGMIAEILVMDAKGLNVGLSTVTSDYWQGDEAKWQKTFKGRPTTVFIDSVQKDISTEQLLIQASLPVLDPASGKIIGAITIGIDVEGLSS